MAEVIDIDRARGGQPSVEGRTPPMDLEAEAAVLSNVLVASTLGDGTRSMVGGLAVVRDILRPENFYSEAHRRIYEAACELDAQGLAIDTVTVSTWLRDRGRLEQVGGLAYITTIVNAAPTCATKNLLVYATTVHEKWRVRQAMAIMQRESALGYFDYGDTQTYIEGVAKQLGRLAALGLSDKPQSMLEVLKEIVREIRDAALAQGQSVGANHGIPFGIPSLDRITSGMHARDLTLVVGPSGSGKTTFALNVWLYVASRGVGVKVFSPEQTRKELATKALCSLAQVRDDRLAVGALSPREWERVMTSAKALAALPVEIDDRRDLHIGQVCARAQHAAETFPMRFKNADGRPVPLGLVIVDHLHHLGTEPGAPVRRGQEKYDSLYHSARRFKGLVEDLSIPGIMLAQMRNFDERSTHDESFRPPQQCVEHCKAVDQVASSTLNLWVPWHKEGGAWKQNRSRLIVTRAKKRHGAYGEVELQCVDRQDRYVDVDGQIDDRINPMIPPTRAMVNQPDPRLPPERDDETFTTEDL